MNFHALNPESLSLDFLELVHHCEMLSDGRVLPRQQDFSLADVSWLYGRLYELDVMDLGPDYYFRVFGIFWQAIYGEDFAGRWLSEIELRTTKLNPLRPLYDRIIASRQPLLNHSRLIWPGEAEIGFERLMVPFSLDGETVSQIVVAAHYDAEVEDMVFYHGSGLPQLIVEETVQLPLAS